MTDAQADRVRRDRLAGHLLAERRRGRPLPDILRDPWVAQVAREAERLAPRLGLEPGRQTS
jgi:hypothetical protein